MFRWLFSKVLSKFTSSRSEINWNIRYLKGDTPWTAHALLSTVLHLIQELYPNGASIFEIGCGYGQEAIALAKLGYQVTAVDLSEAAIMQAKINAQAENLQIHFQTFDVLHDQNRFPPFDLVLDIAVFHTIDNNLTRHKFSQAVTSFLKPQGTWINVSCLNPDVLKVAKTTGVQPPPALSRIEIQEMSKNLFLICRQAPTSYQISRKGKLAKFPALISLLKFETHP